MLWEPAKHWRMRSKLRCQPCFLSNAFCCLNYQPTLLLWLLLIMSLHSSCDSDSLNGKDSLLGCHLLSHTSPHGNQNVSAPSSYRPSAPLGSCSAACLEELQPAQTAAGKPFHCCKHCLATFVSVHNVLLLFLHFFLRQSKRDGLFDVFFSLTPKKQKKNRC